LTHDPLVVCLMQLDILLELLLQSLDSGLEMGSFFDELFLLVDPLHLFFGLLLNVFSIDLNNLGFEAFVILNRYKFTLI
jgi:hypothetical protein